MSSLARGFREIAEMPLSRLVVRAEDAADAESPPLAEHKIGGSVVSGSSLETETQFPSALLARG